MSLPPEATVLPLGYVDEALELLKQLNQLRFRDGSRLSAAHQVGGFETWWFVQHELLWSILIPYCQHRDQFREVLRGNPPPPDELRPDVRRVCGRLRLGSSAWRAAPGPATGAVRRALGRISQVGLIAFSLASLGFFRLARRDTLLYILDHVSPGLDHDFRLAPIYAEVRSRGYRYAETLHARGLEEQYRTSWRNILRRGRPVVLLDMIVRLASKLRRARPAAPQPASEIDLAPSDPNQPILAAVAAWALAQAGRLVFETEVLRRVVRLQGVRRAVIVDDSSVIGQLIAACRMAEIPTLGFMHGNFTRFHSGLMAYGIADARRHTFDLYGVWSEHYRARLLTGDLYDQTSTFSSGPLRAPRLDLLRRVVAARRRGQRPVRALLISEKYAPQDEVRAFVRRLAEDSRIALKVKLRPGEEIPHLAAAPAAKLAIETVRNDSVYESLEQCDVVLGTHSTVLYEAVLAHRPVVVLSTSFTYGNDMVREGLADFVESPDAACEVVLRAEALSDEELERRKSALWGDKLVDGARHLFDMAERELWPLPTA